MKKEIEISKYVGTKLTSKNMLIACLIIVNIVLSIVYVNQYSEIKHLKVEIKIRQSSINDLESRVDELENVDYEDRISDLESRVDDLENK
jgi:hypothetical protein